jgi:uncharacterized membrane protein
MDTLSGLAARRMHDLSWPRVAMLCLFSVYLVAVVAFAGEPSLSGQLTAASGIALCSGLAIANYGWRGAGLLATACLSVTFTMENLGIATGFPFGHYHFEVLANFPHVGLVPSIVGPLYFTVGYLAWIIGSILLDEADLNLSQPINRFGLPIVAAFVMVQWDVVMDPPNATLGHAWIWHDGGGYFGVPLSNYVGWYLTVWMYFQIFALMIYRWPKLFFRPQARRSAETWLVPVALYLAIGASQILPYLTVGNEIVADPAGHSWHARDLRETTVIVMTFTMASTASLAFLLQVKRLTSQRF